MSLVFVTIVTSDIFTYFITSSVFSNNLLTHACVILCTMKCNLTAFVDSIHKLNKVVHKMKKIIPSIIVLALIVGGYFLWRAYQNRQKASLAQSYQTVALERGNLVASIGATGTVRANQTAILPWQTSGTVAEVSSAVGDQVAAGEILSTLKETSLPQTVIMAGAEMIQAKDALDELQKPPTELALNQAQQVVALAEERVRNLEDHVSSLKSTANPADIDQARANVVLAANQLDKAKEDFQPYENKPEDNLVRAALLNRMAQAQKQYDAAVNRLNNLLGSVNAIDLAVAEADLAVAQSQLTDAQEKYQDLLDGPSADDLTAAEARLAAAQATVDLKQISAPFDGTLTQVNVKPGDQVSPGTLAFRLDDLSHLFVDVSVSEVDINQVEVGQPVQVTFDAIPEKTYNGRVSEVAMVTTPVQDVVDYLVTVELTDASQDIKPGMTAAVNIIVNQLENVLLIPNRAVRSKEGQRVVYSLASDRPTAVPITLGASSDLYSELVKGDLKEGDLLVLNPPLEFEQNGPPSFMQGFGG
jgi:HlyD family secretion protein